MIASWPSPDTAARRAALALAATLRPPDWTERAECRFLSPAEADARFFPDTGNVTTDTKWMCNRCPVKQQCRDKSFGEVGFWAGGSAASRRRGDLPFDFGDDAYPAA